MSRVVPSMRDEIEVLLSVAAEDVVGGLRGDASAAPSQLRVRASRHPEHGDFTCTWALEHGHRLGVPATALAERLAEAARARATPLRFEAKHGHLNVFLSSEPTPLRDCSAPVVAVRSDLLALGRRWRVHVELPSADIVRGRPRWAAQLAVRADALAQLLEAMGHRVRRECFIPDVGDRRSVVDSRDASGYEERALERSFERVGVRPDSYYRASTLFELGQIEEARADLCAAGPGVESQCAHDLRAELRREPELEDVQRSVDASAAGTSLLVRIAYERQKFRRGFQRTVRLGGRADEERAAMVRAAAGALGCERHCIDFVSYTESCSVAPQPASDAEEPSEASSLVLLRWALLCDTVQGQGSRKRDGASARESSGRVDGFIGRQIGASKRDLGKGACSECTRHAREHLDLALRMLGIDPNDRI